MSARTLISIVAAIAFVSTRLVAAAEETPNRTDLVALPVAPAATLAPSASSPGAKTGPDIRALLEDPAIRNAVGLSENSWDFSIPDGVPGFGPIFVAEQRSATTIACAERDRQLVTSIEERGNANDVAPDRLAEAGFSMLRARDLCGGGRETDALALYDRTLQGLSSMHASR